MSRKQSRRALPLCIYLDGALKCCSDMCTNHVWNSVDASAGGLNYLLRTRDGSKIWEAAWGKWFISQSRVQRKGSHMAQRWNSCLSRRNNWGASTICVNYETCNFHAYVKATPSTAVKGQMMERDGMSPCSVPWATARPSIPRNPDSAAASLQSCPGQGLPLRSYRLMPCQPRQDPHRLHLPLPPGNKYTCHSSHCGHRLPLWQGWENLVEECLVVWGCFIFSAL